MGKQGLPSFEGTVLGATSVMDVAHVLRVVDKPPISSIDLLAMLEAQADKWKSTGDCPHHDMVAGVLLMLAVVYTFFDDSEFIFPSTVNVNWAQGYLIASNSSG